MPEGKPESYPDDSRGRFRAIIDESGATLNWAVAHRAAAAVQDRWPKTAEVIMNREPRPNPGQSPEESLLSALFHGDVHLGSEHLAPLAVGFHKLAQGYRSRAELDMHDVSTFTVTGDDTDQETLAHVAQLQETAAHHEMVRDTLITALPPEVRAEITTELFGYSK